MRAKESPSMVGGGRGGEGTVGEKGGKSDGEIWPTEADI